MICIMLVCALAVPGWAVAGVTAQDYVDSGLGKLDGDTMDLAAAMADFNSALALDANFGPAYVSRAIVKIWMIHDTPDVKAMRNRFGDTRTIDSVTLGGITGRVVPPTNNTYTFNTSTMNASIIQKLLTDTVVPILNDAMNDLDTAERLPDTTFNFRMPARFLSADTRPEIDITDVYFFHAGLLAAKAAIEILNSWNLDVDTDFRIFKGSEFDSTSDTIFEYVQQPSHGNFFTRKTTWDTAFVLFNRAESLALRFHRELKREADPQDTDLIMHVSGNGFFNGHVWGDFNDSDIDEFEGDHADTLTKIFAGQDVYNRLPKENADMDSVATNFRNLSISPLSRNSFPASAAAVNHGLEWQENFFPDPTFNGFLPGMTAAKLFLLGTHVDTFVVIDTYGYNNNFDSMFAFGKKPKTIDVKFNFSTGIPNPVFFSYTAPGRQTAWKFKLTPKKNFIAPAAPHLRIFFDPDEHAFGGFEQGALKTTLDSTLIYIVPWAAPNASPVDAGSDFSSFAGYYVVAGPNDNQFIVDWRSYSADTLILYKFNGFGFVPSIGTNVFPDSPATGQTRLVVPIDTGVNNTGFGWFVMGEARPGLSALRGFLLGDKNVALPKSFKVQLKNPLGKSTANEPVSFRVVKSPVGSTTGSFAQFGTYTTTGSVTNPTVLTDTQGIAQIQYIMGSGGGIYIIEAKAVNSGALTFLFAFTKGFTPHPGNVWRMVSPPVYPDTPIVFPSAADTAFGKPGPTFSAVTFLNDDFSSYLLYYWDVTQSNSDAKFGDAGHSHYITPSSVQMGRAYWLMTTVDGVLDSVRPDSSDIYGEITDSIVLPLQVGANMIGVPFSHPILSSKLKILTTPSGPPLAIDSASSYVEHRLWWIAPTTTSGGVQAQTYVSGGSASGASYPVTAMFPFEGYWIKVLSGCSAGCTMVFPAEPADSLPVGADGLPIFTGGGSGNATAAPKLLAAAGLARSDNWTVQLIASTAGGLDIENLAGVRPPGSREYMAASSEPPMAPGRGSVALAFKDGDERYSTLFKSPGEDVSWQVEVTSAAAGQVNIQPSDISTVPSNLPLMLRDESTGQVTDLRKELGYSYQSAANETRKLTFAAAALEPGFFTKVIHPGTACLMGRLFSGHAGLLGVFRTLRDQLLNWSMGRAFVGYYYSAHRLS